MVLKAQITHVHNFVFSPSECSRNGFFTAEQHEFLVVASIVFTPFKFCLGRSHGHTSDIIYTNPRLKGCWR